MKVDNIYGTDRSMLIEGSTDGLHPTPAYLDDNPKTIYGIQKMPLHLVPPSAIHHTALAFADGAKKYGPYNWREKTVSSSVYYSAALRHLTAWWDGENISEDAKVHHLGHAMACLSIVLDAESIGKLNDDRPQKGAASTLQSTYAHNNSKKEVGIIEPIKQETIGELIQRCY